MLNLPGSRGSIAAATGLALCLWCAVHAESAQIQPSEVAAAQVCLGADRVMVLDRAGNVWAWGGSTGNSEGAMGLGDDRELNFLAGENSSGGAWHFAAQQVDKGYASIACSERATAGIRRDGSLMMWGETLIPDASGASRAQPHFRPRFVGSGYQAVALGEDYTLALKTDGSLWAWGGNQYGQLGDGSKQTRAQPVHIGSGFTHISAGRTHSAAIASDGSLWLWGSNRESQIGLGDPGAAVAAEFLRPVRVAGDIISVAVGDTYTAAVARNGDLLAWGSSRHAFGRGLESDHAGLAQRIGTGFASVVMDHAHVLARKTDGNSVEWGWRTKGPRNLSPIAVGQYQSLAAGGYGSAGIKADGSLWIWGTDNWQTLVDYGYPDISDKREQTWLSKPTRIAFPLRRSVPSAR